MEKDMYSFIVRIWQEASGPDGNDWRGSIDFVGSDKRLYFQDLESIATFIREQSGDVFRHPRNLWGFLKRRPHKPQARDVKDG